MSLPTPDAISPLLAADDESSFADFGSLPFLSLTPPAHTHSLNAPPPSSSPRTARHDVVAAQWDARDGRGGRRAERAELGSPSRAEVATVRGRAGAGGEFGGVTSVAGVKSVAGAIGGGGGGGGSDDYVRLRDYADSDGEREDGVIDDKAQEKDHTTSTDPLVPSSSQPYVSVTPTQRWLNLTCVAVLVFAVAAGRGLFTPSLYSSVEFIGEDRAFLGLLVSVFSAGRLVSATLVGRWSDRSSDRAPILSCTLIAAVGAVMYVLSVTHKNAYLMLASRVVVGLSGGILSVGRSHTARISSVDLRLKYLAILQTAQFVGFGIAPIFMSFHIADGSTFNDFTVPGWLLLFINVLVVAVVVALFTPYVADSEQVASLNNPDAALAYSPVDKGDPAPEEPPEEFRRLVKRGVVIFILLNFVSRAVLSTIETIGAVRYSKLEDIDDKQEQITRSAVFFGELGSIGLLVFLFAIKVRSRVSEPMLLVVAYIVILAGSVCLVMGGDSVTYFYAGCMAIWSIGTPLIQVSLYSAFSKILGARPQGTMMGLISTAGSVGRIVFALIAGHTSSATAFTVCIGSCAVALILLVYFMLAVRQYKAEHDHGAHLV